MNSVKKVKHLSHNISWILFSYISNLIKTTLQKIQVHW